MQQKGVHWFPGHMVKATREIKERLSVVDVVVEIVDSRCPISSRNMFLDEIIKNKTRMIVFSKKDLCDLNKLDSFQKYYLNKGYQVVSADLKVDNDIKKIIKKIQELGEDKRAKYLKKGMKVQPLRVMIIGIPNVGKSTLINRLAGKNAASTRNTPGHTRAQQWIRINQNFELLDTPGILPPHYEDKQIAINLALIGAIKDDILPLDEVYDSLINFLKDNYPDDLKKRYQLSNIDSNSEAIINSIATYRGFLLKGGEVDVNAAQVMVIKEFRDGKIAKVVVDKLC